LILITNDDGVYSPGIVALYKAVSAVAKAHVVAPKGAQSSSGMSITFHRPLRISRVKQRNYEATAIVGTPADCVFLSVHKLFRNKIEMIVSGINIGENISMQSFFSSGTVSAAMSGSIIGIKSIAFSKAIESEDEYLTEREFRNAAWWAAKIVSYIRKRGFPAGVDLLNINFPVNVSRKTKFEITRMADEMFDDYVVEREDPRGNKYYWLAGTKKRKAEEGTDLKAVLMDGKISVTPISINSIQSAGTEDIERYFSSL
jgi:5'-nucleotidase